MKAADMKKDMDAPGSVWQGRKQKWKQDLDTVWHAAF